MQFLTAPEAISPALNRTASLLFRPFRWGTFLKLCAVAVLTEGISNFQGRGGGGGHPMPGAAPHVMTSLPPGLIPILVVGGLLFLIVCVLLCYLIVRLRFSLFECLVRRTTLLRPGWRRYREQAWRFFLFSIVVGIAFLAVLIAAVAPFASGFLRLFRESRAMGHVDVGVLVGLLIQFLPVLLGLVLLGVVLDVVMRDFMLPHFALENASAGEAWGAVWDRVMAEKGAFLLYMLLRVLLPMVAIVGIFILMIIPAVIIFGSLGVFIAMLHASPAGATPIGIFFEATTALLMVALGMLLAICLGGPLSIAVRNYALVFYGARYQALGDALYPPMGPPATAASPAPIPG